MEMGGIRSLRSSSDRLNILGVGVSPVNLDEAADIIINTVSASSPKGYVCVTGVHGIMESQSNDRLRQIHNLSLMTVPDGMPTVWIGRLAGRSTMRRVYGPQLMREICRRTSTSQITHYLYGASPETVQRLKTRLESEYAGIRIVGHQSPPFRPLTEEEGRALALELSSLKPDVFWVGISTPKQELFMGQYLRALDVKVMIGVGAAFDILAGLAKDAPAWVQQSGFQWLYRLLSEPRRLWRRYLYIVPAFLMSYAAQAVGIRSYRIERD